MDQTYLAQIIDWVDEWKPVLRLQDWQICCVVKNIHNMPSGLLGYCDVCAQKRQAQLGFLDPDDVRDMIYPPDLEQVVVHELLHCYTECVKDWNDMTDVTMLEQMVDGLAWTLVAMKRSGADMTQVRLLMGLK